MKTYCEWHTGHGGKRDPIEACGKPAQWQKSVTQNLGRDSRLWSLCDEHKRLLVDSINEKYQAIEKPLWIPIKQPNANEKTNT